MGFMYRLLALDLDGTLTNAEKKVSDVNKEYIKKAQDSGVKVVLASGRPVIGMEWIARELNLHREGGYMLAYNGGHIIDCLTGGDIVRETIPHHLIHDICQVGRHYDVFPLTYNDVGVICEDDQSEYVRKEGRNNSIPVIRVDSLEDAIRRPVVKFMVVGEPGELSRAQKHLSEIYEGKLNVFLSEPYFLEVTPQGIEKASALQNLCRVISVSREEVIACGDGLNDIPMLKFAGLAVAMENAYEATKKCADCVVASNDNDGVAEAIRRFILREGAKC